MASAAGIAISAKDQDERREQNGDGQASCLPGSQTETVTAEILDVVGPKYEATPDDKSCKGVDAAVASVIAYYSLDNMFEFYTQLWGGEFAHVGMYSMLEGDDAKLEGVPKIARAGYMSSQALLSRCFPGGNSHDGTAPDKCTLVDLGSGFGGTARVAAKEFGCKVICVNIVKTENERNAALSKAAGLEDRVIIPGETSFFDTGLPDSSCDVVCSQDALVQGGTEKHRAVGEAARILKPGGRMVFSDIMRAEHASAEDMKDVYSRREGLEAMGTLETYQKWAKSYGLDFVEFDDEINNLVVHYQSVQEALESRRGGPEGFSDEFIDKGKMGMTHWISAAKRGFMCWGFMVLQKKAEKV